MAKKQLAKQKKIAQRMHAKRRFLERFDMKVRTQDLEHMANMIRNGTATFAFRQSLRVTVWDVIYGLKKFRVVYDSKTKNIVTVFPDD